MFVTAASALILFVGIVFPLTILCLRLLFQLGPPLIQKWHPGVTGFAVAGSCLLLIRYRHQLEPVKRRWMNLAIRFGLAGGALCFVLIWPVPPPQEPMAAFFGATLVAIGMLVLLSIAGFRAK